MPSGRAGRDRQSDSASRGDLTLHGFLNETPRAGSSATPDAAEIGRRLERARRDRGRAPEPVRQLLGRAREGVVEVHEQVAATARPDRLLTLLTEPHRAIDLGDGSWFLAALIVEGAEHFAAWTYWRPSKVCAVSECRLPDEKESLRIEFVLVAMNTGWVPVAGGDDDILVLVDPGAAETLAADRAELPATAAVDGVRLQLVDVPPDSSTQGWQAVRHQVLETRRPVVVVASGDETGMWRLREAILAHSARRLADVAGDASASTLVDAVLAAVSGLRQSPVLPLRAKPLATTPTVSNVVLTKTGDGSNYDVLEETGRRCSHKKEFKVSGGAPKKYAGVLKYLEKHHPGAVLIAASACKTSGCHLVWVEFRTNAGVGDDLPVAVADPRGRPEGHLAAE